MRVDRIILASTSVFRRELLDRADIAYGVEAPTVDESVINDDVPERRALLRSKAKGQSVAERFPSSLTIGADQVLGFNGRCIGKVESVDEARRRLQELSGKKHTLFSAFSLHVDDICLHEQVCPVEMHMRLLRADDIDEYLKRDEWPGTVGCYRFESLGVHLFERVIGEVCDQSAIIGLPMLPLMQALRKLGIDLLRQPDGPWQIHQMRDGQ